MSGQLGYYRYPTINRDNIVFVSEDDLWRVGVEGGSAERLTANPGRISYPRLSPDGRTIAFASRDEGQNDIYTISVDGGAASRLTYFGANSLPVGWSRDGQAVIVSTDWQQPFAGSYHLWTVPLGGGRPEALNWGPARALSRAARGGGVVIGRHSLDPARWKRYRGGRAGQLWVDRQGDGEFEQLGADLVGNLADPMWIGRRIYFISDHEGHGNVYSVTPTGRNLARHTDHDDFFARFAHSDGSRIVYHAGADLWLLDPAGEPSRLDVKVPSARPERNRRFQSPGRFVESFELHPNGHSLALVARGHAFTAPLWEGAPTKHGGGSASRERLVTWLSDGERVAYISDDGGEEHLVVGRADGTGDSKKIEGDFGRAREMVAAPAGPDRVAISNHRHELLIVDLSRGTTRKVYEAPFFWLHGIAWSPDGRWIAAGASQNEMTSSIVITNARTGRSRVVTRSEFGDAYPSWDPSGKMLYFLSSRVFNPFYDGHFHDYSFPRTRLVAAIPLTRDTVSPFAAVYAEPRPPGAPPMDKANGDKKNGKPEDGPPEVTIDFAGIEDRVLAVPAPEGVYAKVAAAQGKVFFLSYPMVGSLGDRGSGPRGKLEAYDLAAQKVETVHEGVSDFTVSADGKILGIRAAAKVRVVPTGFKDDGSKSNDKPSRETGWLDLGRFRLTVEPGAEWQQMLAEAWRLQREYFWRKDMAKVDWNGVLRRYRPLVDRVATRAEFSDLMWEMQGELGTSHAYELGGDYLPEPKVRQGSLGADLTATARGVWTVERIPRGDSWTDNASPLAAPGLDVRQGDRLVSVEGTRVSRSVTPYEALADRAGRPVTIEMQRARRRPRRVVVKALGDESSLRYRDWVNTNREVVHSAFDGRAGYLHLPDMGAFGFAEFHRSFLAELEKDGLVVDVRYNRGGNVSQLLLARLLRKRIGYRITRWNPPRGFPYESAPGPMVCLTNEDAGSDGDIFSHTWKMHGLGPLIGTRTWGGVTGIWPQQTLVDGTITTQPEYGSWFDDVGYDVENYGTDPDIEVVIAPQDWAVGRDPQMERGLAELAVLIEENRLPRPGAHPSMRAPRLPKRR